MLERGGLALSGRTRSGIWLWSLFVLLAFSACQGSVEQSDTVAGDRLENVAVVRVKDGDSFSAKHQGLAIEVRLFGIDAPERNQPYSKESRLAAVKLLGQSSVELVVKDKDRYGRVVAEAYTNKSSVSVNQRLVELGAAWVYRQYNDSPSLIAVEEQARQQRVGLWSLPVSDRIEPRVWRKRNNK